MLWHVSAIHFNCTVVYHRGALPSLLIYLLTEHLILCSFMFFLQSVCLNILATSKEIFFYSIWLEILLVQAIDKVGKW